MFTFDISEPLVDADHIHHRPRSPDGAGVVFLPSASEMSSMAVLDNNELLRQNSLDAPSPQKHDSMDPMMEMDDV